ncbi:MAG TPA: HD domain-containing protein [Candidatus Acetothermia bacterium]|nr:HD domain-containing protein [Candidatus Acetothermia bacterium]
MGLNIPTHGNARLEEVITRIDASERISTLWAASNVTAIDRMHINDHGPVHIKIVTNIAIKLLRLLVAGGVEASVVRDHKLANEDAEVIVCVAAALHDIGHVIHRHRHEELSLILAPALIEDLLEGMYSVREATILEGEILHAIHAHRRDIQPLTIEAGAVKVADALDMESGRARIPFKAGSASIHAVSALAIKKVEIMSGEAKPVRIHVHMLNSAGIFQLDTLLREKLSHSGLSPYVEVVGEVVGPEKKIIERYEIE